MQEMAGMRNKNLYTPAQFASMFHIDRQTLIYYDKEKVFSPCYRNENGYRYYSADQIFDFVRIQSLRHLKIQGVFLQEYMSNRTSQKLTEILHDKVEEYEKEIRLLTQKSTYLNETIRQLSSPSRTIYDQPLLMQKDLLYYQRSRLFPGQTPLSQAFLQAAPLMKIYGDYELIKDLTLSISCSPLPSGEERPDYRILLTSGDKTLFPAPLIYPSALYAIINIKAAPGKETARKKGLALLQDFIHTNHLSPQDTLFQTFLLPGGEAEEVHPYIRLEIPLITS